MEVDQEITHLIAERNYLTQQLSDLKGKVESLNSLKRSFDLYCDKPEELGHFNRTLFKVLSDKQIQLRLWQEKELVLNGYLVPMPEMKIPTVIECNKELRLRKQLQEIELLSNFLMEHAEFQQHIKELEPLNEMFDLAIESGASDKIESVISIFHNFFEKAINMYNLESKFHEEFKEFSSQIVSQLNAFPMYTATEVTNLQSLQNSFKEIRSQRLMIESEVDKLLYQFNALQNGKKFLLHEMKNLSGELESILFKEYAVKQKIQELRQYKSDLNTQKQDFMNDPSVDGYTAAMQQLESVENRFRRLMAHTNLEKSTMTSRFFFANKAKAEQPRKLETSYNKTLFLVLHNHHVNSQDKAVILRLSKPSKLINSNTGKFFYQRTNKHRSLANIVSSFKRIQVEDVH